MNQITIIKAILDFLAKVNAEVQLFPPFFSWGRVRKTMGRPHFVKVTGYVIIQDGGKGVASFKMDVRI